MAVNTKTEYALRALLAIYSEGYISAQKICDEQKLPKKFIEHLLSLLKAAGLVKSTAGSAGGYELARDPLNISFQDLLKAVGDKSYATSCENRSLKYCLGDECSLSPFFSQLESQLDEIFQSHSLQDIINIWERKNL